MQQLHSTCMSAVTLAPFAQSESGIAPSRLFSAKCRVSFSNDNQSIATKWDLQICVFSLEVVLHSPKPSIAPNWIGIMPVKKLNIRFKRTVQTLLSKNSNVRIFISITRGTDLQHCINIHNYTICLPTGMVPISEGNDPVIWLLLRNNPSANGWTFHS